MLKTPQTHYLCWWIFGALPFGSEACFLSPVRPVNAGCYQICFNRIRRHPLPRLYNLSVVDAYNVEWWMILVCFFSCQLLHSYVAEPVVQNNAWGSEVISCALIIEDFDTNKEGWKDWPNTRKKCETFSSFWLIWRVNAVAEVRVSNLFDQATLPEHSGPFPENRCVGFVKQDIWQLLNSFQMSESHICGERVNISASTVSKTGDDEQKTKPYNCGAAEDKQTREQTFFQ